MRSLEYVINDIKSYRDESRKIASNSTTDAAREIATFYSNLMATWVMQLEESNRLINMQSNSVKSLLTVFDELVQGEPSENVN